MKVYFIRKMMSEQKLLVVHSTQEKPIPTMDQIELVQVGRLPEETTFHLLELSIREQDDINALLIRYSNIFTWQYD